MCSQCEGYDEELWEEVKDVLAMRVIAGFGVNKSNMNELRETHDKAHPPGKEKLNTCSTCRKYKSLRGG